ncbi:MAG: hypothetical protein U1F65_07490 [Verrucomicrobiota bacterium]
MASNYDPTDFVDDDFQTRPTTHSSTSTHRAPSREEVDARVGDAQQKLAELKRQQEELERERASLEEVRRRQMEFQNGRQEMVHNLTRGLGLLEEAEFTARRDAEQMAKTVGDFREALAKVQAIHEETWTKDTFNVELTRALTSIENARMEWNAARLKFPILSGQKAEAAESAAPASAKLPLQQLGFGELCKIGFAMTWPLTVVAIIALAAFLVALFRSH